MVQSCPLISDGILERSVFFRILLGLYSLFPKGLATAALLRGSPHRIATTANASLREVDDDEHRAAERLVFVKSAFQFRQSESTKIAENRIRSTEATGAKKCQAEAIAAATSRHRCLQENERPFLGRRPAGDHIRTVVRVWGCRRTFLHGRFLGL